MTKNFSNFGEKLHQICISKKLNKLQVYKLKEIHAQAHRSPAVKSQKTAAPGQPEKWFITYKPPVAMGFSRSLLLDTIQVECEVTIICESSTATLLVKSKMEDGQVFPSPFLKVSSPSWPSLPCESGLRRAEGSLQTALGGLWCDNDCQPSEGYSTCPVGKQLSSK